MSAPQKGLLAKKGRQAYVQELDLASPLIWVNVLPAAY